MVGRWLSPSLGDTSEAVKSPPGSSGCRVHTFEERKFSVYYTRFTNKRRLIKGGRKQSGGGNKVLKSSPYWLKRIRKGGRVEEEGPFVGFFQLIVDRRSSLFSPQKYRVSSRSGSSSRGEGWQWRGGGRQLPAPENGLHRGVHHTRYGVWLCSKNFIQTRWNIYCV